MSKITKRFIGATAVFVALIFGCFRLHAIEVTSVATYTELKTAIANGGSIKLTADISVTDMPVDFYTSSATTKYYYLLSVSKDTTIDLNGHNLTWDIGTSNSEFSTVTYGSYVMFYVNGTSTYTANTAGSYSAAIVDYVGNPAEFNIKGTNGGKILVQPSSDYEGTLYNVMIVGIDKYEIGADGKAATYQYTYKDSLSTATLTKLSGQKVTLESGTLQIENNSKAIIKNAFGMASLYSSNESNPTVDIKNGKIIINSLDSQNIPTAGGVYFPSGKASTINMSGGQIEIVTGGTDTNISAYGLSSKTVTVTGGTIGIKKCGPQTTKYTSLYIAYGNSSVNNSITNGNFYIDEGTGTTGTMAKGLSNIVVTGGAYNFDVNNYVSVETHHGDSTGNVQTTIFGETKTLVYRAVPRTVTTAMNMNTSKEYLSLITAVKEADPGDSIKLMQNDHMAGILLTIDKPLTIDLNGYTLSSSRLCSSSSNCAIDVNLPNATDIVTFTDNDATSNSNAGTLVGSINVLKGILNVEKININANNGIALLMYGAKETAFLNVKGVTMNVNSSVTGWLAGWSAIYAGSTGLITLDDYNSSFKLVANVTGTTTGTKPTTLIGTTQIASNVIINGGTYNINGPLTVAIYDGSSSYSNVKIVDGIFNLNGTEETSNLAITRATTPVSLEGGLYTIDPSANCAEGYKSQAEGTKYRVVSAGNSFEIDGTGYTTLEAALNDAEEGDTIKLLRNYSVSSTVTINNNITFNMNGFTLTFKGSPAIYIKKGLTNPLDTSIFEAKFEKDGYTGYYYKFSNAFNLLSTLTLNKNVTTSTNVSMIMGTKKVDLNGYDITYDGSYPYFISVNTGIQANKNSKLELVNTSSTKSTINGSIVTQPFGSSTNIIIGSNVKINTNTNSIVLFGNGEDNSVVLDVNGTIISQNGSAITGQGNYHGTVINVKSGATIKSNKMTGIYQPQKGVINIEGGEVIGNTAIGIKGGILNVKDGKITGNGILNISTSPQSSGISLTGDAIYLEDNYSDRDVKINITGGTISSTNGKAVNKLFSPNNTTSEILIKGGIFTSDPSDYLSNGYESVMNENGTFKINKINVESGKYSLTGIVTNGNNAIAQIKQGGLVLFADTVENNTYSFDKLASGTYNLVVTNGTNSITKIVTISKNTTLNITLPLVGSSKLVVGTTTPNILVDGLDNIVNGDIEVILQAKSEPLVASNIVQKTIKEEIENENYNFYDFTLLIDQEKVSEASNVLKIAIPYDLTTMGNITVSRMHNGELEKFTEVTKMEETYVDKTFYLDKDNNYIYIFASKFSTYAIGYDTIKVNNPKTADNILKYALGSIISLGSLIIMLKNKKKFN